MISFLYLFFFLVLLCSATHFVGTYLAKVFQGEKTFLYPIIGPLERYTYRLLSINPLQEMSSRSYLKALLGFNLLGFLFLFFLLLLQRFLPFNPEGLPAPSWALAFNIAASFTTNTNWQPYGGETTLSYGTQMFGLTVQNFLSAATGISTLFVLIRGVSRTDSHTVGNYWVDMVRTLLYLLLPLALLFSLLLLSEGTIQTLRPYVQAHTLEGAVQILPRGPVASQTAIQYLGSNGGGFFRVNSAHPFANPTALTNLLAVLGILLLPSGLIYTYGLLTESRKHALLLFAAVLSLWGGGVALSLYAEHQPNPLVGAAPYLEGKEMRFGILQTILYSVSTTATSNGAINASLDSLSPLAGGVALLNMMLGELVFGGVGSGLASLFMFILLTLFLSGLMVGRTPEYMGKKIGKREMQWVSLAILIPGAFILLGSGIFAALPHITEVLLNKGPHGLSALLYTFTSCAANNGSAFASVQVLPHHHTLSQLLLSFTMIGGRLAILIPTVMIGGELALKKKSPFSLATFSTNTFLFFLLLLAVILLVGALTYFPSLSLGPIVEFLLLRQGVSF